MHFLGSQSEIVIYLTLFGYELNTNLRLHIFDTYKAQNQRWSPSFMETTENDISLELLDQLQYC